MNFAIIGTGDILATHEKAIKKTGNKLIAIYSKNKERAEKLAKDFNCKAYHVFEEILDNKEIEILNIINEPYLHAELGLKAAEKGKHLLIEKPFDTNIEKAEKLIKLCQEKNLKLGIIHQRRYDTAFKELKELVENNKLGKIQEVNLKLRWFRNMHYYKARPWRNDPKRSGGGVIMQQGLHFIDLALWIFGEVESTKTNIQKSRPDLNVEDTATGTITFKSGVKVNFDFSTVSPNEKDIFEVRGSESTYRIQGRNIIGQGILKQIYSKLFYKYGNHSQVIRDFVKSIKNDETPYVDGNEGLKSIKLIKELYNSVDDGTKAESEKNSV